MKNLQHRQQKALLFGYVFAVAIALYGNKACRQADQKQCCGSQRRRIGHRLKLSCGVIEIKTLFARSIVHNLNSFPTSVRTRKGRLSLYAKCQTTQNNNDYIPCHFHITFLSVWSKTLCLCFLLLPQSNHGLAE